MVDNEYINSRLNDYLKQKKIKVQDLERHSGLTRGVVYNALKNRTGIGADKIAKIIVSYPDLNPAWLLTGEGSMFLSDAVEEERVKYHIQPINGDKLVAISQQSQTIEVVEWSVAAGLPHIQEINQAIAEVKLIPHLSYRPMYYIKVSGDSMQPLLDDGDVVAATPVYPDEVLNNKVYIIHTHSGEALIKRVIIDKSKQLYMLISDNLSKYLPFALQEQEILAFFRVMGKHIPID